MNVYTLTNRTKQDRHIMYVRSKMLQRAFRSDHTSSTAKTHLRLLLQSLRSKLGIVSFGLGLRMQTWLRKHVLKFAKQTWLRKHVLKFADTSSAPQMFRNDRKLSIPYSLLEAEIPAFLACRSEGK